MGPGSVAPACRAVLGLGMVSLASTPAGVRTAPATCCYWVIPSSTTPSVSVVGRPRGAAAGCAARIQLARRVRRKGQRGVVGNVPSKLASLPGDAMHLVVSICGNDVLRAKGMLAEPARSVAADLANLMEPSVLGGDSGAGYRRAAGPARLPHLRGPAAATMTRRAAVS